MRREPVASAYQFPEWFPVGAERKHSVRGPDAATPRMLSGRQLAAGLPVTLEPGKEQVILVKE